MALACSALGCDAGERAEGAGDELLTAAEFMTSLPRLAVEPELRIDGYEADLVPVTWLGVAPDGTIALLQDQDDLVRFFDPSGGLVAEVGGPGEGPGEFGRLGRAGWLGDTLWVSDTDLQRITLISPRWRLLRMLPPLSGARPTRADSARLPTFTYVFPYAAYPGDTLLAVGIATGGDARADAIEGTPLLRLSRDGVIDDLALVIPRDDSSVSFTLNALGGSGYGSVRIPFHPDNIWAVSPHGRRVATVVTTLSDSRDGSYRVEVFDGRGARLFARDFPFEGVPIPPTVVDSVIGARIERAMMPAMAEALDGEVRRRVPPVYPPVSGLLVGTDGRSWIGLTGTAEGSPWLALDPAGNPIGLVVLPENTELREARGDRLWTVEEDELGVESVVRYRLRESGG